MNESHEPARDCAFDSRRRFARLAEEVRAVDAAPERHLEGLCARRCRPPGRPMRASSTIHLRRVLSRVRELGRNAGVVLDPGSPISFAERVLQLRDVILVMTVNPGFGGQKFLSETLPKISELRRLCQMKNLDPWIEVDGGQNGESAGRPCVPAPMSSWSVRRSSNRTICGRNFEPRRSAMRRA
jgi:ribulose-phosphate 3-epimerase